MHPNRLYLTTALVASVFMLSACNKPGAAPAPPATNAAAVPAVPALPAEVAAPTVPGGLAVQPAPATGAEAAPERFGRRMGKGMGRRMGGGGMAGGKGGGKGAMRAACAADIQRFCTGGGKVGRCLKTHASELSAACAQAREQRKEARRAGR